MSSASVSRADGGGGQGAQRRCPGGGRERAAGGGQREPGGPFLPRAGFGFRCSGRR